MNGDALDLPFPSETFDRVFIAFGIRNIMNRQLALSQFYRVLKPGGKLAVLELTTPQAPFFKTLYLGYFKKVLPWIGAFFQNTTMPITTCRHPFFSSPSPEAFSELMSDTGFRDVRYKPMTLGIVTLFVGSRK